MANTIEYPGMIATTPQTFDVSQLTLSPPIPYGNYGTRAPLKYNNAPFRIKFDPPDDAPVICRYGVSAMKGYVVEGGVATPKANNDLMFSIGIQLFNEIDQSEYHQLIVATLDKIRNSVIAAIDAKPIDYIKRLLSKGESSSFLIPHIYTFPKITIDGKKVADESSTHKVTWYTKLNIGSTKLKHAQQIVDNGGTCTDKEVNDFCYTKFYDVTAPKIIEIKNKRRVAEWAEIRPINGHLEPTITEPFKLVSFVVEFQGVFFGASRVIQVKLNWAVIQILDAPLNRPIMRLDQEEEND